MKKALISKLNTLLWEKEISADDAIEIMKIVNDHYDWTVINRRICVKDNNGCRDAWAYFH